MATRLLTVGGFLGAGKTTLLHTAAQKLARRGLHPSAAYIFRKQMEEADIIVINKIDTLSTGALALLKERLGSAYPGADIFTLCATGGQGVDAGQRLAEVDYDIYAEGEAGPWLAQRHL